MRSELLFLAAGAAVGGAAAYLFLKAKFAGYPSPEDVERKIAQKDGEIVIRDGKIIELSSELASVRTERDMFRNDRDDAGGKIAAKDEEIAGLERKLARAEAENRALDEKLAGEKTRNNEEIRKLHEQMNTLFENTANKIFEKKSQDFVNTNREKIGDILKPLNDKIAEFQKKVEDTYNAETREMTSLKDLIKHVNEANQQISKKAEDLTRALKGDSKVQGDWGEVQLEALLQRSGLTDGVGYRKQANFKDGDGVSNLRPDFVVNLPGGRHFIIDSKVSLTAYERYYNAESDEDRNLALKEHADSVNRHIRELSDKKYEQIGGLNQPDFVFMFVPVEAALSAAAQNNPRLIEDAMAKNVMLASASTLLFALRTVAYIWRLENQNKNVLEIAKVGGELYDKFVLFTDNMVKVGNQMDSAKNTYREAMGQLTKKNSGGGENAGTIVGKIERLKKLGANATKQIGGALLDRAEE